MNKIKIAQIGIGHDHSTAIFNTLKSLPDVYEIVGYALPESEKQGFEARMQVLDGFRELSVDEVINDPEIQAVTIETEEKNLTKYALAAAQNGKHIHMDKPGGMDWADFQKLVEIARAKQLVFHMGYMYRYNPEVMRLMDRIRKGELGTIFNVEAQMNGISPPTTEKRQWLDGLHGGMMFFLGCHLVDLIIAILGEPTRIVPLNKCTGLTGDRENDYGFAAFEYPKAMAFAKTCAQELGGFPRRQLVVCGTRETVEIKPLEMHTGMAPDELYTDLIHYTNPKWADRGEAVRTTPYHRYKTMMTTFGELVRGERENPYTYDYELMVYKCVLKACGLME